MVREHYRKVGNKRIKVKEHQRKRSEFYTNISSQSKILQDLTHPSLMNTWDDIYSEAINFIYQETNEDPNDFFTSLYVFAEKAEYVEQPTTNPEAHKKLEALAGEAARASVYMLAGEIEFSEWAESFSKWIKNSELTGYGNIYKPYFDIFKTGLFIMQNFEDKETDTGNIVASIMLTELNEKENLSKVVQHTIRNNILAREDLDSIIFKKRHFLKKAELFEIVKELKSKTKTKLVTKLPKSSIGFNDFLRLMYEKDNAFLLSSVKPTSKVSFSNEATLRNPTFVVPNVIAKRIG